MPYFCGDDQNHYSPIMCQPMIHFFKKPVSHIALPEKFTYPFHYTPHPLCVLAAEEVKAYIAGREEWQEELAAGKMFGVLVVERTDEDGSREVGYLAAFSGNLAGKNRHSFFVPPVYDLLQPDGFFKKEESMISAINIRIAEMESNPRYRERKAELERKTDETERELAEAKKALKTAKAVREQKRREMPQPDEEELAAMIRESQYQKAAFKRLERDRREQTAALEREVGEYEEEMECLKNERKERSAALQRKLFEQFRMLNARGEARDLYDIFAQTLHKIPPGGAGECALPKLLQYAYLHRLRPVAMAEFWWGGSPKNEIRHHGYYYPSCKGKCEPILQHMLQGLKVDDNPLLASMNEHAELEVVYEDDWLLVVNKPAGMLSVPGKENADSVYRRMRHAYPQATGAMVVHRLDMATSGLLLIAKTEEVYKHLQAQFRNRTVKKRYVALLEGVADAKEKSGKIALPLCPDLLDRPRQMVNREYGKEAVTEYRILENTGGHTRVAFYPQTGRTHQLRMHAAHPEGLGCPIWGDELYGRKADRLYLHAEYLEFRHPVYGDWLCVQKESDF